MTSETASGGGEPEDPYELRRRLTFEQAEGAEPLPSQLLPKEISQELRAKVWLAFHAALQKHWTGERFVVAPPWSAILFEWHVARLHLMADDFNERFEPQKQRLKDVIEHGDYLAFFGLLQWLMRHRQCPSVFRTNIASALASSRAAYRVIDGKTIVPVTSELDSKTLEAAFADVAGAEFRGARAHLSKAAEAVTVGDHAGSIRESISAVESVARVLDSGTKDLGGALTTLERGAKIHPAMKRGFTALYGYTSDEQGIRHALLDEGAANVDEADALFMLGACAAFVSYMINKARNSTVARQA